MWQLWNPRNRVLSSCYSRRKTKSSATYSPPAMSLVPVSRALQTPSHLDELCELAEIFTSRRLLNLTIEEAKCAAVFGNVGYAVATVISVPKQPGWSVGFLDICRSGHNIKILHCKKPADFQISEAAHRSGRPGFNFGSLPWVWSGPASCRPAGPGRDVGNLSSYWR